MTERTRPSTSASGTCSFEMTSIELATIVILLNHSNSSSSITMDPVQSWFSSSVVPWRPDDREDPPLDQSKRHLLWGSFEMTVIELGTIVMLPNHSNSAHSITMDPGNSWL